jgi:GT2 family glycosyltransferase
MSLVPSNRIGVVLVNWKGWRDTLLSLEALFAGDYLHFDVVVVDNASGDDSVENILAWAEGRGRVDIPVSLQGAVHGRAERIPVQHILQQQGDSISFNENAAQLVVLQAASNTGFAGGNNLGLRYLRQRGGYAYYWLLNNDAFPAPAALTHLVNRAQLNPDYGMIGSTLVFSSRPGVVQALGGAVFDHSTGRAHHIGADLPLSELAKVDVADIERRMAYVVGASMLVSERFIDQVGLMEESYFLYFEEIDWAERGRPNFVLGYARESIVFHKAGGSTQSASRRSTLAAYFLARNRLVFTKRFHPENLSSVLRGVALETLRYLARARWTEARGFARAFWDVVLRRR